MTGDYGISQVMMMVGLIAFVFVAYGAAICWTAFKNRRRTLARIRREWGKLPERSYSADELEAISHYYLNKETDRFQVDDITWNDLDMDRLFIALNHTRSFLGESYLYNQLRTPSFTGEELEKREKLIRFFQENARQREQLELEFAKIGKTGTQSVFDYIYNLAGLKRESILPHVLSIVLIAAAVGVLFAEPRLGILLLLVAVGINASSHYQAMKKVRPYVMSCTCLMRMMKFAREVEKLELPGLEGYLEEIGRIRRKFRKFKRNTWFLLKGGEGEGSMETVLIDYVNICFHVDLIQFSRVIEEIKSHIRDFERLADCLGELESGIAVASFRACFEGEYCLPVLEERKDRYLEAENIYHPLIAEPVKNSIRAERGVLLTGSNASGKSTFLKTVAVNVLLGQTIHTCMGSRFSAGFFRVYTSMALRDDLLGEESYYIVEIKSLKRIMDHAGEKSAPVLACVDEVLRGTNTVERIAASSRILASMEKEKVLCFAATHDIELTRMLDSWYDNYHFQEEVRDGQVIFDYRLYEGRAWSRNAIKLLEIMGYDEQIIAEAENAAEEFVRTGEWKEVTG